MTTEIYNVEEILSIHTNYTKHVESMGEIEMQLLWIKMKQTALKNKTSFVHTLFKIADENGTFTYDVGKYVIKRMALISKFSVKFDWDHEYEENSLKCKCKNADVTACVGVHRISYVKEDLRLDSTCNEMK